MAFSLLPPIFTVLQRSPAYSTTSSQPVEHSSIAYNIVRIFNDTVGKKSRKIEQKTLAGQKFTLSRDRQVDNQDQALLAHPGFDIVFLQNRCRRSRNQGPGSNLVQPSQEQKSNSLGLAANFHHDLPLGKLCMSRGLFGIDS